MDRFARKRSQINSHWDWSSSRHHSEKEPRGQRSRLPSEKTEIGTLSTKIFLVFRSAILTYDLWITFSERWRELLHWQLIYDFFLRANGSVNEEMRGYIEPQMPIFLVFRYVTVVFDLWVKFSERWRKQLALQSIWEPVQANRRVNEGMRWYTGPQDTDFRVFFSLRDLDVWPFGQFLLSNYPDCG